MQMLSEIIQTWMGKFRRVRSAKSAHRTNGMDLDFALVKQKMVCFAGLNIQYTVIYSTIQYIALQRLHSEHPVRFRVNKQNH